MKENKIGRLRLTGFKTYNKATIIMCDTGRKMSTLGQRTKQRAQKLDPQKYIQLVFYKGSKANSVE